MNDKMIAFLLNASAKARECFQSPSSGLHTASGPKQTESSLIIAFIHPRILNFSVQTSIFSISYLIILFWLIFERYPCGTIFCIIFYIIHSILYMLCSLFFESFLDLSHNMLSDFLLSLIDLLPWKCFNILEILYNVNFGNVNNSRSLACSVYGK